MEFSAGTAMVVRAGPPAIGCPAGKEVAECPGGIPDASAFKVGARPWIVGCMATCERSCFPAAINTQVRTPPSKNAPLTAAIHETERPPRRGRPSPGRKDSSAPAVSTRLPHAAQNLAPAGDGVWHCEQSAIGESSPYGSAVPSCDERLTCMLPVAVNWPVLGLNSSAALSLLPPLSIPPAIRTEPFLGPEVISTAVCSARAVVMAPTDAKVAATGSYISAVATTVPVPSSPPVMRIFPVLSWVAVCR